MHCATQGVFWLGRPWLFRPVIKFLVFFVSFVITNSIYFAVIFGPKSCFFSRTGFQGLQVLPWWVCSPTLVAPANHLHYMQRCHSSSHGSTNTYHEQFSST